MILPGARINRVLRQLNIINVLRANQQRGLFTTSSARHSHETPVPQNIKGADGHYDVIIVGGGPAGLSMACGIGSNSKLSDKRVLLLDGAPKFKGYSTDTYSNRVFAINRGTVELMKSINAWDTITGIRHRPVKQMQVWDSSSDAMICFQGENFSDDMAYIVENDVLVHAILKELEKCENVCVQNGSKIEGVQLASDDQSYGSVTLKTGEQYSCNLLIGADGANSLVRRQMNVEYYSESYDQMGVIATVNLKEPTNNYTAWQRFLVPGGVLALLPLSDCLSSIVWSTSTSNAKQLLQLPEGEFVDALNDALFKTHPKNEFVSTCLRTFETVLGPRAGTASRQLPPSVDSLYGNSRAGFPLGFGHSSTYVTNGTALIGDAAHRVHPLAGQGLNLGFGDVSCLVDVLAEGAYSGFTINNSRLLKCYETQRLRHNVPIMLGIHGIQKMYSSHLPPVVLARSLGLQLAQSIEPLKKMFMERAMR